MLLTLVLLPQLDCLTHPVYIKSYVFHSHLPIALSPLQKFGQTMFLLSYFSFENLTSFLFFRPVAMMDCTGNEEKLRGKSKILWRTTSWCSYLSVPDRLQCNTLHWLFIFVGCHLGSAHELHKVEAGCEQLLCVTLLSAAWLSLQATAATRAALRVRNLTFSRSVNLHNFLYSLTMHKHTESIEHYSEMESVLKGIEETMVSQLDRVKYVWIITLKIL